MSRRNSIIVTANPRGVHHEGYINAALKPGHLCQIDVSEGVGDDGRFDWEAYNQTDGNQRLIAVLCEDHIQGKTMTQAYVSGDRAFLYTPVAGEELNVLVDDITGTGDDHSFGDLLIIDNGTGRLIATTGTPESEPFILLEDITDPTADTLAWVMYTGY